MGNARKVSANARKGGRGRSVARRFAFRIARIMEFVQKQKIILLKKLMYSI